uniref:two component sensor kinase n=1 Tax=Lithothamnion corallioides TaxID=1277934 RepID=UPI0023F38EE2|nr:two component sensor kinase [Lithothamnion corallioides]WEA76977.1 two component sensor kinase [Lithothamnion corallioides]
MNRISQLWLNINLKTRLMSVTTLAVSLLMSSLTFWALTTIQKDSIYTDTRFCRDLSMLFTYNLVDLIDRNNYKELISFIENVYLSTSSIRYIQVFTSNGDLSISLPFYDSNFHDLLQLYQNILQLKSQDYLFNIPIINYSIILHDSIINLTIPLIKNGKSLGILNLGINSNPSILSASRLIQDVSVAIFVSIWLMVIISAVFNALIITEPIKELLTGLENIASGNFSQKITSSFDGELGDLIISFNEMAERLESYEEKNVEQLTSEKAKLETLVATIADGAILLDTELRLLFVNQIAIKVFHWSNKDLIGTMIFQHLPLHVNEALLPILNGMVKSNCLDNNMPQAQEICIDLNYESLKTFRFLLATVLDQNNKLLRGLVITIQDITREAQLNEAKNRFVSNVSHELRTPLCNISSFLETLIDYNHKLSLKQKMQFLSVAHAETQRLNRLVNDVLDLSRLESEYNYILRPIQLINTVSSIIRASQIIACNKKIKIIFEISSHIESILAHESSLCQVLSNLISNSLKFTHLGGRIIIRVYPLFFPYSYNTNQGMSFSIVRLEIIDEGIGIDKNFQHQIFDRFMRIENHVHTLEGTGLGLSIVKNIIEKHNSNISLYSEVGIGTSFWFDLFIVN